jgi:uncharacterized membrane protein
MHKKEKNTIDQAETISLAGSAEVNIKAIPTCDNADFRTGSNRNILAGNKSDYKTSGIYSALSQKLYLLILIGLSVAVLLLLAGFGLNFFNGSGSLSLESLQEHALKPDVLIDAIKNNQMPASLIISYTGLLVIILVPAAGLIYILGYFTHRKKYYLALTAAGVLFILILSAVIGLLKS